MRDQISHIDLLHEITDLLNLYRTAHPDIITLRDMRKDLAIMAVDLSDTVGEYLQLTNDCEYQRKKAEDEAYLRLRQQKGKTASDAERLARIEVEQYYLQENETRGIYKTLDLQHKSILKTLDTMAAKSKEEY